MKNIKVKLIWFSERDGNGIVQDTDGNEYYIDTSVLKFDKSLLTKNSVSRHGLELLVDRNFKIKDCLCGTNVRLIWKQNLQRVLGILNTMRP